jgi:multidrug efflux system membrane fusion protein
VKRSSISSISLIAVTSATAIGMAACRRSEAAPSRTVAATPIAVAQVGSTTATTSILAVGTLAGKEELPLSFKIGGVVSRIAAEPGQVVKAGTVLAELAPTEIGAEVEKAKLAQAKAERDLARAKSLYKDSVVTLEQLQNATTAFEFANSNVKVAEFNKQYAVIRAPFDGVVLKRSAEAGQLVGPGAPIVQFRGERRGLVLRAGLADRDVVRVSVGSTATVRFDAYAGESFTGRVTQIAPGASLGTGTYEIEISLDTRGRALASGLVGHAELAPRAGTRVPSVPVEALLEAHGDSATVFELSADRSTAQRRRVRIGALVGDQVVVLGGLGTSATVVTAGGEWLADGARVRISTSGTAKAPK